MPDDREPKRRAQTSTERDIEGLKRLRNTPVHGVMALPEPIWDDHTPPPVRVPTPEDLRRDDAIEQIRVAVAGAAISIEHEKRARHEGELAGREMGAINEKIGTLATEVNKLDGVQDIVHAIALGQDRADGKIEKLLIASEVQEQRENAREKQVDRVLETLGAHGTRITGVEHNVGLLKQQLDTVRANEADHHRRITAVEQKAITLDARQHARAALTRREKAKFGGAGAVAGAVLTAISWLASHIFH